MIVVDANVAIAILNSADRFHRVSLERCLAAPSVSILNLTRAEALIHPTQAGVGEQAGAVLDGLGFTTQPVTDDIAGQARMLRARYGNRHFPIVDAIVVAFGLVHNATIVTCDAKWPAIDGVELEVLQPNE